MPIIFWQLGQAFKTPNMQIRGLFSLLHCPLSNCWNRNFHVFIIHTSFPHQWPQLLLGSRGRPYDKVIKHPKCTEWRPGDRTGPRGRCWESETPTPLLSSPPNLCSPQREQTPQFRWPWSLRCGTVFTQLGPSTHTNHTPLPIPADCLVCWWKENSLCWA